MKKLGTLLVCFALLAQLGTVAVFAESEVEAVDESIADVVEDNIAETQTVTDVYAETDTYILSEIGLQVQFPKGTPVNTNNVLNGEEELVISALNQDALENFFTFWRGVAFAELYGTDVVMRITMKENVLPDYGDDYAFFTEENKVAFKEYVLYHADQYVPTTEATLENTVQSEEVYGGIPYVVTKYVTAQNPAGSIQYATIKNGNLYCFLVIAKGGQENIDLASSIAPLIMQTVSIERTNMEQWPFEEAHATLALPTSGYVFTPDTPSKDPLYENIGYGLRSKIRYGSLAEPDTYAVYASEGGLWFLSFKTKVLPAYRAYTSFTEMNEAERADAITGIQNATMRSKAEYTDEFMTVENYEMVFIDGVEYLKTFYNVEVGTTVQSENLVQYATFVNGTFYVVECYSTAPQQSVALVETEEILKLATWQGYYTPQLALLVEIDSIGLRVRVPGRFWQIQTQQDGEEWDYNSDLFLLGWDNGITPSIYYDAQELLKMHAEIDYQSEKLENMNTLTDEERELILSDLSQAPIYIAHDFRESEKNTLLNSGFIETEHATFIFTEVLYQDTEPWSDAQYEYRLFFSTVVNGVEYRVEFVSRDKELYQCTREEVLQMVQSMAFTEPVLDEEGNIYVAPPPVPEETIEEKTTEAVRSGLVIGPIIGLALAGIILLYLKKKTRE